MGAVKGRGGICTLQTRLEVSFDLIENWEEQGTTYLGWLLFGYPNRGRSHARCRTATAWLGWFPLQTQSGKGSDNRDIIEE